jgi:antitoxin component YwqK of YwqJK toxin-antitoxin module
MNKLTLFLTSFFFCCINSFGQPPNAKTLFVIDSIPILTDPEDWNQILPEDISDMNVLKDKDALKTLGWGQLDSITYIFTKEYRNRPDSLKEIPTLKKMLMKDGAWNLHGIPYTGRYIDYYNNGRIQDEGLLSDGKQDGALIIYFKGGGRKSVTNFKDGIINGTIKDYYKNGSLMQTREYIKGKETREIKMYFINGRIQFELRLKKETHYDTSVTYYSTGKIKQMRLIRDGAVTTDKNQDEIDYNTPKFYQSLNVGDLKEANKSFYKIWKADSTSIDTRFKEGILFIKELHFDEAIADFDKALEMEPLMREALVYRGVARLKKNQLQQGKISLKNNKDVPFVIEDISSLPKQEQEKICTDLLLADKVDFTDYYVKKIVPEAILNYCREKSGR